MIQEIELQQERRRPQFPGVMIFYGVSPARATKVNPPIRSLPNNDNLTNKKSGNWNNNRPLVHTNNHKHSNKTTNSDNTNKLKIFHQNVRGIGNKISELETHLLPLALNIICITEHHLSNYETDNISINHYKLGATYCRTTRKHGGVIIFVHESLTMTHINLRKFCNDFDLEASAVKVEV